jgi:predicted metal-dependent hydrolase
MSIANGYLKIGDLGVDVVYKDIKNVHISVYPPLGRVRVAAPLRVDESAIRLAIVQRLSWIRKQQEQLMNAQRQSQREMVTGESHYFWGRRLQLIVHSSAKISRVELVGNKVVISCPISMGASARRKILMEWYRSELKATIPSVLEKWENILGFTANTWTVRRMKTKWGSCNPDTRSLWFNIELAKKDPACLEYIVVHELAHFLERTHSERFVTLMDAHLPNWRATRDLLNGAPLAEESWS